MKSAAFDMTAKTSIMGQSESSPYSNSDYIKKIIIEDQWQSIVGENVCIDIYLNAEESNNKFKHKYIIQLDSVIPPNCIMSVLFPNHPNPKKRVLWTTGNLNDLSKEINHRLAESAREGLQLAITSGNDIYRFHNILGPIYLVWAERINIQTMIRQENIIKHYVPILIETNGQWSTRNIFIFGDDSITKLCDVTTLDPIHYNIYCCETDPRKETIRQIPTISQDEAKQMTMDLVVRTVINLDQEPPPFSDVELILDTERF
jgi:hypothetical protein